MFMENRGGVNQNIRPQNYFRNVEKSRMSRKAASPPKMKVALTQFSAGRRVSEALAEALFKALETLAEK